MSIVRSPTMSELTRLMRELHARMATERWDEIKDIFSQLLQRVHVEEKITALRTCLRCRNKLDFLWEELYADAFDRCLREYGEAKTAGAFKGL